MATTDVEPDGTHELWLGASTWNDAPDQIAADLRRVVTRDDALEVEIVDEWRGLLIGPWTGAGCLDVDDDGVRELIELEIHGDSLTFDELTWMRRVSELLPATAEDFASGTYDRAVDTYEISLLTTFSCGDDLVPLERVAPPAGICGDDQEWHHPAAADVDGDGVDDQVVQKRSVGDSFLRGDDVGFMAIAVCLSSGPTDEVQVGGMGEIFDVTLGPGGHPVIWTGSTTLSGAYRSAMVVENGRLVFVEEVGGPGWPFGLWDGAEFWPEDESPTFGMGGCADVDGDGLEEFVQIEATIDGDRLDWTRSTWGFDGRWTTPGPMSSGSASLPPDFEAETDGWSVFNDLDLGLDPLQGGCG